MRTTKSQGYLSDYWYWSKNIKGLYLFIRYWPLRSWGFQIKFNSKKIFTFWGWQGLYGEKVMNVFLTVQNRDDPPEVWRWQHFLKTWERGLIFMGFMFSW